MASFQYLHSRAHNLSVRGQRQRLQKIQINKMQAAAGQPYECTRVADRNSFSCKHPCKHGGGKFNQEDWQLFDLLILQLLKKKKVLVFCQTGFWVTFHFC